MQTESDNRLNYIRLVSYYLGFLGLGATLVAIGPTLPDLAEQTGVTLAAAGFLFTIRSVGSVIGASNASWIYKKLRAHHMIAIALSILAITIALTPLIPSFWLLCVVLLIMGFGSDLMQVGGTSSIMRMFRGKVGPYMNAQGVAFGIGMLIAPVLVLELLLRTGELRYGYWVLALLFVPTIIAVLRLPDPPMTSAEATIKGTREGYRMVISAAIFLSLVVGIEVTVAGWVATYATTLGLMPRSAAGLLTSAFLGMIMVGRFLAIPVSGVLNLRALLSILLLGCIGSVAILIWIPGNTTLWGAIMLFGTVFGPLFPTMLGYVEQRVPVTGSMNSIYFIGGATGAMIYPWVAGQLFVNVAPTTLFRMVLVMILAAVVIFGVLLYPKRDAHIDPLSASVSAK